MVNQGKLSKTNTYRIMRKNKQIAKDLILSHLKKFKNDVLEIKQGEECGICFENFDDFQPGDLIQAFDLKDQKKGKSYK